MTSYERLKSKEQTYASLAATQEKINSKGELKNISAGPTTAGFIDNNSLLIIVVFANVYHF